MDSEENHPNLHTQCSRGLHQKRLFSHFAQVDLHQPKNMAMAATDSPVVAWALEQMRGQIAVDGFDHVLKSFKPE